MVSPGTQRARRRPTFLRAGLALALMTGLSAIVAVPGSPVHAAGVLRVDADASPGGDGLSWGTAFDDLQDALGVAIDGDQIWVAEGTYTPGSNRSDSFVLDVAVELYGGFASGETLVTQRDPANNVTTLSGDIGTQGVDTDNVYHVVSTDLAIASKTSIISGFTVTGGYADGASTDGRGGGLLLQHGTVTVDQLAVTGNHASTKGAAMSIRSVITAATVTDSVFTNNTGSIVGAAASSTIDVDTSGGFTSFRGIDVSDNDVVGIEFDSDGSVVDATITNNDSNGNVFGGGGIRISRSDVTLANVSVVGNCCQTGAGIRVLTSNGDSSLTMHNVLVANNLANGTVGGGIHVVGGQGSISPFPDNFATVVGHNVTFAENRSNLSLGASSGDELYVDGTLGNDSGNLLATLELYNSIVWNSRAHSGSSAVYAPVDFDNPTPRPSVTYTNSLVAHSGSSASWNEFVGTDGGGNIDADPMFVSGVLGQSTAGDYRIELGSPAFDAGDETLLPTDAGDVDNDANTSEDLPLDLDGTDRVTSIEVDMGAYEGVVCPALPANRIYVDGSATGAGTGLNWTDAITELRTALNGAAYCPGPSSIDVWVADGTYTPSSNDDRNDSFTIPAGLEVYGGFAGGEGVLSARNPDANPTILSGAIGAAGVTDNSFHVVHLDGVTSGRIDGFMIKDGHADGIPLTDRDGAGLYLHGSSPVLANLVIESNFADDRGAGVLARSGSFPEIWNSVIRNNVSDGRGGGIFVDASSAPPVHNSLLHDNQAAYGGGGYNNGGLQFYGSTITQNIATTGIGGGGLATNAGGLVDNTIIWGNTPGSIGGTSTITKFTYSDVEGSGGSTSWSGVGSDGGNNVDVDPKFLSPGSDNFRLSGSSTLIDAGLDSLASADSADVDDDGNTAEKAPDLAGGDRIVAAAVDIGAYEVATDTDLDGVPDSIDNCPDDSNADQTNTDGLGDGGDACDDDDDQDGVDDNVDNCSLVANPDQANTDLDDGIGTVGDALGDACDPDDDNDGWDDALDNCPLTWTTGQQDADGDGIGDACDPTPDPVDVFVSLTPARFADSRDSVTFDDKFRNTGPRAADSTWEIDIAGRGDVPADATAAVLNLTVLNGQAPGFATVHPCGTLPKASSVNYAPVGVEPNEVITKLSAAGTICVFTKTTADVIVDVVGYTPSASPYAALTPARFADSRDQPTFDDSHRNTGPRAGDSTWEIQIAGRGDVPAAATAAVINLTVTGGAAPGFATVHPCGTLPKASSLNYGPGITRPNELIAKLSAAGTICVYTKSTVDVIVDVVGYIEDAPGYTALTPARYADSRDEATFDNSYRNTGPRAGDTTWEIQIAGRGDVPADATTAVINLTVTGAAGPGFATAHPCGTLPKASSINYDQTTTRPNELIAKLSPTGTICIYTKTATHIIVDVVGHT